MHKKTKNPAQNSHRTWGPEAGEKKKTGGKKKGRGKFLYVGGERHTLSKMQ